MMKQNPQRSKSALEIFCAVVLGMLIAAPLIVATDAHAEPVSEVQDHPVTVVTLYSEVRSAPGIGPESAKVQRPPIQIVDGGVKSSGDSCWELSATGQITTVTGNCYVLRSAAPGEHIPSN